MAVYDSKWGNRGKDKCPNKEFEKEMMQKGKHYTELEESFESGGENQSMSEYQNILGRTP